MSNTPIKTDVPEMPPEVLNRRPVALTRHAAESEGLNDISVADNEAGITRTQLRPREERIDYKQIEAINELTKAPPGFEPAAGMPAAEVMKIMGRNYPGQPAQDPMFGDRTPEFICWLFENHPVDAHIRYLSRLMPDAGRWIAKAFPKFKYVPGKRVSLAGLVFPDHAIEALIEAPVLRGDYRDATPADSPEVAALKARIAELEKKAHPLVEVKAKRKYTRKAPPAAQTPAKAAKAAKTPAKPTPSTQPPV